MKTIDKLLKISILLFSITSYISCQTDIPETDTTPPRFSFQIKGDGFNHTFTQDDNFDSFILLLKINTDYTFIYSGSDQGGMKQMQLDISDTFRTINYTSAIDTPWRLTSDTNLHYTINWNGNRNDPLTGAILYGTFTTGNTPNGGFHSATFNLYLADFGGQSANGNTSFGGLNIQISDYPATEIINF